MNYRVLLLMTLFLGLASASAASAAASRIALFWNEEFTDDVQTSYEDYDRRSQRRTSGTSEVESHTQTEFGSVRDRQVDEMLNDVVENTSGTRTLARAPRRGLREDASWRIQGAFLGAMREATGARFIDRAAMIRIAGRKLGDGKANLQALESAAVTANADLLMQVLMEEDAASPIGLRFNVRVTRVADSSIVGVLSTLALPSTNSRVVWATNAAGFEKRVVADPVSIEDYGQELARQVAAQLAR